MTVPASLAEPRGPRSQSTVNARRFVPEAGPAHASADSRPRADALNGARIRPPGSTLVSAVTDAISDAPLAPLTTLRLGGPAHRLVTVTTEDELVEAVRACDTAGEPVLVLAGGSNVVIADAGFEGTVVRIATHGVERSRAGARVRVRAAAGEPWDDLVASLVADGLAGVECLAGIPGSTGATPIQNVGAYGQEVASAIRAVRVLDRRSGEVAELDPAACGFGYRSSVFKHAARHVVLGVTFELTSSDLSEPLRYAELAGALDAAPGDRAPLADVRTAVLALRRGKAMLLDPGDHDTWSAGSFFTNPIIDAAAFGRLEGRAAEVLGSGAAAPPRFPETGGRVKTSAAWLIERAGFRRGQRRGAVGLSTRHALALTNRGGATTAELLGFAQEIVDRVDERFGVRLEPEPVLVGVALRS